MAGYLDTRCWGCATETGPLEDMEYQGSGKYKCPKCGHIEDFSKIIYPMRVLIQRHVEDEVEYKSLDIVFSVTEDERLNKVVDKDSLTTLKDLILEEFNEDGDWRDNHALGLFDIDVVWNPYSSMTDMGMEYDCDFLVINEKSQSSFALKGEKHD